MPAYATAEEFGKILREHREIHHWAQATVAKLLADNHDIEVTASAVGDWERGGSIPTRDKVFALEKVFDLAPGELSTTLGYSPPVLHADLGELHAHIGTPEISASGVDLEELRRLDPEAYALIRQQVDLALDRARERRQR